MYSVSTSDYIDRRERLFLLFFSPAFLSLCHLLFPHLVISRFVFYFATNIGAQQRHVYLWFQCDIASLRTRVFWSHYKWRFRSLVVISLNVYKDHQPISSLLYDFIQRWKLMWMRLSIILHVLCWLSLSCWREIVLTCNRCLRQENLFWLHLKNDPRHIERPPFCGSNCLQLFFKGVLVTAVLHVIATSNKLLRYHCLSLQHSPSSIR